MMERMEKAISSPNTIRDSVNGGISHEMRKDSITPIG